MKNNLLKRKEMRQFRMCWNSKLISIELTSKMSYNNRSCPMKLYYLKRAQKYLIKKLNP